MQCNKSGCKQSFHVTCAQALGLLCEEAGNYQDNVKYCGYCEPHFQKIVSKIPCADLISALKVGFQNKQIIKTIPAYKPIPSSGNSSSPEPNNKSPRPAIQSSVTLTPLQDKVAVAESNLDLNPSSPTSSNDSQHRKKGRRPNSAASDHGNDKNSSENKVPNGESPSASSSNATSASSSKQSSTSSLTDAASSPDNNESKDNEMKPAPVIVKLAKADGVYKKVETMAEKKPVIEEPTESNGTNKNSSEAEVVTSTSSSNSTNDLKAVSITMSTSDLPPKKQQMSAYDFSDNNEAVPPMRKDSPAKIIPINGKSTGLKIETTQSNSLASSEKVTISPKGQGPVSPVKSQNSSSASARFSKSGKRIGRPPKKGTMLANSSLGNISSTGPGPSSDVKRPVSPPSSPENDDFGAKRRKTSPNKR